MKRGGTILINDLALYWQRAGVASYLRELLRALDKLPSDVQIRRLSRTIAGVPLRGLCAAYVASRQWSRPAGNGSSQRRTATRRAAAEAVRVARKLGVGVLDRYLRTCGALAGWRVYHEPDCLAYDIPAVTIATVHDLSVLLFPQWHPAERVRKYERKLRDSVARSAMLLTDSEATRRDLIERIGVAPERVTAIPLAPRPRFRVLPKQATRAALDQLALPPNYLLYVGTVEPRKNVAGLLRAYALLPATMRRDCPLLLAGGWGWRSDDVRGMLETAPWNESVRWLGYLSETDLVRAVNGARGLVYPSFHEGFGLPPLEAMACGTPVITTHAGALAEVVGDAALIVDPDDHCGLADAMRQLLSDAELALELRDRGLARQRMFSWADTARRTLDAYRKAA